MLVIDRKVGESILIGKFGDIKIKILPGYINGSHRIGIEAPIEIPIFREEKFKPSISQDLVFLANHSISKKEADAVKSPSYKGNAK